MAKDWRHGEVGSKNESREVVRGQIYKDLQYYGYIPEAMCTISCTLKPGVTWLSILIPSLRPVGQADPKRAKTIAHSLLDMINILIKCGQAHA